MLLKALFRSGLLVCVLMLQGCVGALVGATVDVAIEVVKVPFKVGGAIVDVMTDDDEQTKKED